MFHPEQYGSVAAGLNFAGLCRGQAYSSQSAQESQQMLAQTLSQHELTWRGTAVDTQLLRAQVGRCELMLLRYGAEVEIRSEPFDNFVLMQMPLHGSAMLHCDGRDLELPTGQMAVLAPGRELSLIWKGDCEQLLIKLPRALLEGAHAHLLQRAAEHPMLPSVYTLAGRHCQRGLRLIGDMMDQLSHGQDEGDSLYWQQHLEDSLATFMLTHQPAGAVTEVAPLASARNHRRKLEKLEQVMRAHLDTGLTLQGLAQTCGMSPRSVSSLCQRAYGETPMEHLRNLRLDAVREGLLTRRYANVTEAALQFGFTHLGRFSAYYRARFGELPRRT